VTPYLNPRTCKQTHKCVPGVKKKKKLKTDVLVPHEKNHRYVCNREPNRSRRDMYHYKQDNKPGPDYMSG